ncbi:hypothetical protein PHSY_006480 [Pseudozyma hubeiensis SY62]|uniref:Uncharacterized protein n=1 Tax=Pseudozyma hubeiensis (strain SY62) TaxID=1305764 RepID=R9PLC9_PSEHS|nr:hypothetical protein PHSY_006480 [Pseudozyma hubeiensis SY62]GAC98885.1 hypothetical protein PHSY_006480 [Pseudozyma hubeiensis SY62]
MSTTASTPPRSRQGDRPYRPPPSSSARFYERQQQRWMLPEPDALPHTPERRTPEQQHESSSIHPLLASPTRTPARHSPASTALASPPSASPSHTCSSNGRIHDLESRSPSGSNASATSRLRAASVSTLAPPELTTRARSGSAGSFTRSRISNGYHSTTDDEFVERVSPGSMGALPYDRRERKGHLDSAALASRPCYDHTLYSPKDMPQQPSFQHHKLEDSGDADWDAELGISEADHAEPLRLPALQQTEAASNMSEPIADAPSASVTANNSLSNLASMQGQTHIQSINTADLRGLRVTSAVSENWDDDFLFQNDDDSTNHDQHVSRSSQPKRTGETWSPADTSVSRALHSSAKQNADSDEEVENWDDAFSWNADSMILPSNSTSSSLYGLMTRSDVQAGGTPASDSRANRGLPADRSQSPSRHVDFQHGRATTSATDRLSDLSSTSHITDLSAFLASQSDLESSRPRLSHEGDVLIAPGSPRSRQHRALGPVGSLQREVRTLRGRSDGSGDDTETETPVHEAVATVSARPARRSLGSALGFDVRRKGVTKETPSSKASPSRAAPRNQDETNAAGVKYHAGPQSKSKLGALQRFSFSRSRLSVANMSSSSINEVPEVDDGMQQLYLGHANQSQASIVSRTSTSSNRSRRRSSPSSLEKSYTALRSTSFRRMLGRGEKKMGITGPSASPTRVPTPLSPPRRGADLSQATLPIVSPPRDVPSKHAIEQSTSPPSVWAELRRSLEVTPTRNSDRKNRTGGSNFQRDSQGGTLSAQSGSPRISFVDLTLDATRDRTSMPPLQLPVEGFSPSPGRLPRVLGSQVEAPARNVGLRRDFSSSNTLRAGPASIPGLASTPSQVGSSKDVSKAPHSFGGEKMLRGQDGRSSAGRSVSASTAHSQTSTESLYGFRMRKQFSVSSGADALDSETSYGTSVGSSPGFTRHRSSASYCKADASTASALEDSTWLTSADVADEHGSSSKRDVPYNRSGSMQESPIAPPQTLNGAPSVPHLPEARKQHTPDTSFSLSQDYQPTHTTLVRPDAPPAIHSRGSGSTVEQYPGQPREPIANSSVASASSSGQAMTSTAASSSPRRSASRRNSLSDLKIPSRISKAQTGIRNNMNLVRDFAKGIEELKVLKASYMDHKMRTQLVSSDVEEKVRNWLECADVLIGLGEGRTESDSTARVDTVSHTPLSGQVAGRRTTFSNASERAGPASPLDDVASRAMLSSGARSISGTSQGTSSTVDDGRSVEVHREIDILSTILGGQTLSAAPPGAPRSHARFQSETYSRDDLLYRNTAYSIASSRAHAIASRASLVEETKSGLPGWETSDELQSRTEGRSKTTDRPYNTAPVLSGPNVALGEVIASDGVDVGDVNRSAKRRLRRASRAGLQGLRELLKVFKGTSADGEGADTSKSTGIAELGAVAHDIQQPARVSIDGRPSTPTASKQKRKSLNLKRRSFLRSRTSLDSVSAKGAEALTAAEVTPPLPLSPEEVGTMQPSSHKIDRRKPEPSPAKSSLNTTWEAESADHSREAIEPKRPASAAKKEIRRISFQSALGGGNAKRQSVDLPAVGQLGSRPIDALSRQSLDARPGQPEPPSVQQYPPKHRRPSLAARPAGSAPFSPPDPRRASTSVDTLHLHNQYALQQRAPPRTAPSRSYSSTESDAPVVQKLALRPEAMPGLLVYVQATKQHLQAAIDEINPTVAKPSPVRERAI